MVKDVTRLMATLEWVAKDVRSFNATASFPCWGASLAAGIIWTLMRALATMTIPPAGI
ncbi:MAG: hypothetical protein JWM47_4100 [Acidimicrobiales bacterium]|nr:hypothetical protein [Acidimicrobiales bacterium]